MSQDDGQGRFFRTECGLLLAAAEACRNPLNYMQEHDWYDSFLPVVEHESRLLMRFIVQTRQSGEIHHDFRARIEYLMLILQTIVARGSSSLVTDAITLCAGHLIDLMRLLESFSRQYDPESSIMQAALEDDFDNESVFPNREEPSVLLHITRAAAVHSNGRGATAAAQPACHLAGSVDSVDSLDKVESSLRDREASSLAPWRTSWIDMCLTAVSVLLVQALHKVRRL